MSALLSAIIDMQVLFFDLLIYTKLTALKKDTHVYRVVMYGSCGLILLAYYMAAYVFHLPAVISSFFCMSIPSVIIFWLLSKYKGARFFTTFCFVDTISLIIAFFARLPGLYRGAAGDAVGCVLVLVLFLAVYIAARPYFSQYRQLLDSVPDGWNAMMVSTILIYLLLIFTAAYPQPIRERLEYIPLYGALSAAILSFYTVFISSLLQKKKLYELNRQLAAEVHWHSMAYIDPLTGLQNRMAYMERISALTRTQSKGTIIAAILDIDSFKAINDTFGHHAGDTMLAAGASILEMTFEGTQYETFRIGGDEFAVIGVGCTTDDLEKRLKQLNTTHEGFAANFSYGYSIVSPEENNAVENAFMRADANMYIQKKRKKELQKSI